MFSEVVLCGGVEDGKGSEVSMKGSAMKAAMSEMVSLGEEGDDCNCNVGGGKMCQATKAIWHY